MSKTSRRRPSLRTPVLIRPRPAVKVEPQAKRPRVTITPAEQLASSALLSLHSSTSPSSSRKVSQKTSKTVEVKQKVPEKYAPVRAFLIPEPTSDASRITDDEASTCSSRCSQQSPLRYVLTTPHRHGDVAPRTGNPTLALPPPPPPPPPPFCKAKRNLLVEKLRIPPSSPAAATSHLPDGCPLSCPPRLYVEDFQHVKPICLQLQSSQEKDSPPAASK